MVLTILRYVFIGVIVLLILMWLWAGGASRVVAFVKTIPNPVSILLGNSSDSYVVSLPWQVPIPQGPDLSGYAETDLSEDPAERLAALEREYDRLEERADALKTFGEPSPYRGRISLSALAATENAPASEYLEIEASYDAGTVSISGWSVQSVLTGVRVQIPPASARFLQGAVNSVEPIVLRAGERVLLNSGQSPVGVSFRETMCTGYLSQFQRFEPQLSNSCPMPSDAAPINAANLRQYGEECLEFIARTPQCQYPAVPNTLPASCRLFIANTFSYNGCVATYRSDRDFYLDNWRVYFGSPQELWRNSHDVIRLLDAEGKTVDAVTY